MWIKLPENILKEINDALLSEEGKNIKFLSRGYQGATYRIDLENYTLLIKKTNVSNPSLFSPLRWLRSLIDQKFIRHENKIYQLLDGIKGIPKCYGLTENSDLILEFIEGDSFRNVEQTLDNRDQFFKDLLEVILCMHKAGISHGDLKRKDNILVSDSNQPYLIDFGTALHSQPSDTWPKSWLFNIFKQTDLNAWIKHKYARNYDLINKNDMSYYSPNATENIVRIIRRFWRTITLRNYRKSKKQ